jgi:hypothetical protein
MTKIPLVKNALTAKQRLAVSRHLLVVALEEPVWLSVVRWWANRGARHAQRKLAGREQLQVNAQSNQAAVGRTPS